MKLKIVLSSLLLFLGILNYFTLKKWVANQSSYNFMQSAGVYFVRNNLSDLLWCISFIIAIDIVRIKFQKRIDVIYFLSLLLPVYTELLQKYNLISGTFDSIDLLIYIVCISVYLISNKNKKL